ncbi:MAG TPA: hypothetical protein VHL57_07150, partial [Flavobacteriales bacterium]|nr:hypothetical protein [Flavobacteriales bacterium]
MRCLRLLLGACVLPLAVRAQQEPSTLVADTLPAGIYAVVVQVGGGASLYPGPMGTPTHLSTQAHALGWSGSVRVMWHPDHRLRVGIESGRVDLYRYTIDGPGEAGSVRLTAVPLLLMWSMPITKHVALYAGYGTYLLQSELDYFGRVRSQKFSLGYAAALSYVRPLSRR